MLQVIILETLGAVMGGPHGFVCVDTLRLHKRFLETML